MAGHPRKPNEPARARKNWTEGELQYLSDKYGLVSKETLARNLERTEGATYLATKRHLNHQRIYDNFYCSSELARVLAKDAKTIVYWASRGWLKGRRAPYCQGANRIWLFTEKNVVRCLRDRPWLVNLKKLPEHYFRAVVRNEWDQDPWYAPEQAAPLLGLRDSNAVHRYIYLGWLPAGKKPGGPWQGTWIIRRSAIEAFLANDPRSEHKHAASSAARIRNLIEDGRPVRVGMVWRFGCPACGLEVKIMAPPKMFGPEVRERFIKTYVNGVCSHGSVCRIGERPKCLESQP